MNIQIKKAEFNGFGSKKTKQGLYVCASMDYIGECGIVFYDKDTFTELCRLPFDRQYSVGNVFCILITKDKAYEADLSVYRLYCDTEEFVDPYSFVCTRDNRYGLPRSKSDYYSVISDNRFYKGFDNDSTLKIPYENSIFYLAHVRGLTMLDASVKKKGTFLGVVEKIPYFKDLGINGLMLMPIYEFNECELLKYNSINDLTNYKIDKDATPSINFWGFKNGFYFSPKQSYSASSNNSYEFSEMIYKLHKAGIEVILMMYFDSSNSDKMISQSFILSVLRYYVTTYHVDGFRILGQNININEIVSDPFLRDTKLIFDDTNLGRFYSEKPLKYKNLGFLNSDYQDMARRFIKGDENTVSSISFLFRENNKTYQPIRNISDYYGFTVNDLFTYNFKHNEANGEDNSDGNNFNYSWNCGIEGPTKKNAICKLRKTMFQNAMLMMLLPQGTPLLRSGDEILNSTNGNNNPWCMDNETGWVSYSKSKINKDFYEFTKALIAFRKRHHILHQPKELRLYDYLSVKLPDVSFHSEAPFKMNQEPVSRSFAILYCGDYAKPITGNSEDSIYIVFNMYWEKVDFSLPVYDKNYSWYYLFSSDGTTPQDFIEENAKEYTEKSFAASPRSVSIFILRNNNTK